MYAPRLRSRTSLMYVSACRARSALRENKQIRYSPQLHAWWSEGALIGERREHRGCAGVRGTSWRLLSHALRITTDERCGNAVSNQVQYDAGDAA